MPFLTEAEPKRGVALDVLPGIRRIVARNPGVMTYHGTNTYLIAAEDGLTVLDPGPDDPTHVSDILEAAGDVPIRRILLSHTHRDHLGATAALKNATNAATYGFHRPATPLFTPDHGLKESDELAGLTALHTPGHASDHLAFAYTVAGAGDILFSADHVMSWSSSIVNPPDGDMKAYYNSLLRLLDRHETVYLPGHGPLLPEPRALVAEMLAHRRRREAAILEALRARPSTIAEIAARLYAKQNPMLKIAAERNVLAHLLKLRTEGIAIDHGDVWAPA
ncbi:MBL fold metallo-hydrolase [Acidiphilium sp. AL]|uniref:MBL fold metallo-hydrolase n=1 Tax=Acidiphilium sp. AL TaxID=2871704 RepID=UPI0021CB7835|nr:MBL fold metallo-hydrolase [Acidiphilium sp. AL]MCU4161551.1 MBL fold metallo-hydrolase [Acidiphilium sp. AL]